MFRHPSGLFAITVRVNDLENQFGLFWLIDFIAANQKRVRKRIKHGQEWRFALNRKRQGVLEVFSRSRTWPYRRKHHFTFNFTVIDYTGPPLTLYLEDEVLFTEGEPDADL
jgi:hypothetical protein